MKRTKQWKVGRTMQKQVGIGKQDFAALREVSAFTLIRQISYGSGGTTGMMLR